MLDAQASDWKNAIAQAGDLLIARGVAGESYTRAMIDSVEQHGSYIVIAPGFAFAHARADQSVKETAMSLVRLAEPVEFGHKTNDPVTLVLALSAVDAAAHQQALAQLAKTLANPAQRAGLDKAKTPEELLEYVGSGADTQKKPANKRSADSSRQISTTNKNLVLTVCGNGLNTSLFLKNTLEQVLDYWGWSPYLTVEATDTISARGKASDADFILTSGEIAKTLGEVDVPVYVIQDFTSQ